MNFLDLHIEKDPNFNLNGILHTSIYVKPRHFPQYLHVASAHPVSCKVSVFKAESFRFLVNNNSEQGYHSDIERFAVGLKSRGHVYIPPTPVYDTNRRLAFLKKIKNRKVYRNFHDFRQDVNNAERRSEDQSILFVCQFTDQFNLNLKPWWNRLVQKLYPHKIEVASRLSKFSFKQGYRNNASMFLLNYRLNFPSVTWEPG